MQATKETKKTIVLLEISWITLYILLMVKWPLHRSQHNILNNSDFAE